MNRFQKMFVNMLARSAAAAAGTRQRLGSLMAANTAVGTSVALLCLRVAELHKEERGDGGGNALTTVLLAVGGVLAVGAVVAGVGVAIAAALGKLG